MAKCKRCSKGNFFTKINNMGLCQSCQNEYDMYVSRNAEILIESNRIVSNSNNIATKFSRSKLVLEKLYVIRDFGNSNFDLYKEFSQTTSINDAIRLQEGIIEDLSAIYLGFQDIILDFLNNEGAKTKREIIEVINYAMEQADADLPYDIEKSVTSILDNLEFEQKISKEKIKNRYHYLILR